MRSRINAALKDAMKAKDSTRLSTLRLINAAIKDRDIANRTSDDRDGVGDDEILAILGKMIKQRQDSAKAYEEGGRLELAEQERSESEIIREFMPKQLSEAETAAAVKEAIAKTGAETVRDMGRVMASLKGDYQGQIDFGKVGGMVKDALG